MDLTVRNVRFADGFPGEPVDIGVACGKIARPRGAWQKRRLKPMMRAGVSPAPI
jgi:hypothetical protein